MANSKKQTAKMKMQMRMRMQMVGESNRKARGIGKAIRKGKASATSKRGAHTMTVFLPSSLDLESMILQHPTIEKEDLSSQHAESEPESECKWKLGWKLGLVGTPVNMNIDMDIRMDMKARTHPSASASASASVPETELASVRINLTTLKWMVGKIVYFRTFRDKNSSKWINISSAYWKAHVRDYRPHLYWLIRHGVIIENGAYSNRDGKHFTKSYELHDRFQEDLIAKHRIKKRSVKISKELDAVSKYLNTWLSDHRLEVDYDHADEAMQGMSTNQQNSWIITTQAFRRRDGGHRDQTSNRFHSVITRTPRYLRSMITFGGKHLFSIDVKNSQPYFLSLKIMKSVKETVLSSNIFKYNTENISKIFVKENIKNNKKERGGGEVSTYVATKCTLNTEKRENGENTYKNNDFTIKKHDENIANINNSNISYICGNQLHINNKIARIVDKHPVELENFSQNEISTISVCTEDWWAVVGKNIIEYIESNHQGQFYELLATRWDVSREEAKHSFMMILFGENKYKSDCEKEFELHFPDVYKIIREEKVHGHNKLAIALQSMESDLIIDHACVHLMEHHPNVPIYTLHDSILTIEEHVPIVQQVIYEQFQQVYGSAPYLKIEEWLSKDESDSNLNNFIEGEGEGEGELSDEISEPITGSKKITKKNDKRSVRLPNFAVIPESKVDTDTGSASLSLSDHVTDTNTGTIRVGVGDDYDYDDEAVARTENASRNIRKAKKITAISKNTEAEAEQEYLSKHYEAGREGWQNLQSLLRFSVDKVRSRSSSKATIWGCDLGEKQGLLDYIQQISDFMSTSLKLEDKGIVWTDYGNLYKELFKHVLREELVGILEDDLDEMVTKIWNDYTACDKFKREHGIRI
ncbi:MAG: hypothetical protein WAV84_15485 [Bacteroidota bacterium]